MKCNIDDKILTLYFYGKASRQLQQRIEQHLKECSHCRQRLELWKDMSTVFVGMRKVGTSAQYDSVFEERLAELEKNRSLPLWKREDWQEAILDGIERVTAPLTTLQPVPALAKVALAVLLIAAVSLPVVSYIRPVSPRVILAQGTAELYDKRTESWRDIDAGTRLAKGSLVRTGKGNIDLRVKGKYHFRLDDNSVMEVTGLSGTRNKSRIAYGLKQGLILVSTEPDFKDTQLRIHTLQAEATVRGTTFLVDVMGKDRTSLAVLDGAVEYRRISDKKEGFEAPVTVVNGGFESTVVLDRDPTTPVRFGKARRKQLMEAHTMGEPPVIAPSLEYAKKVRYDGLVVVIIAPDTVNRAESLLHQGWCWTNDREPKPVAKLIKKAERLRTEGEKENDTAKHLEAIANYETIVRRYPDSRYNPQFLLFIGVYYDVLGKHEEAVARLQEVVENYRDTEIASMAQYAIGIIYEERLHNRKKAEEAYRLVVANYKDTPEAIAARMRLKK